MNVCIRHRASGSADGAQRRRPLTDTRLGARRGRRGVRVCRAPNPRSVGPTVRRLVFTHELINIINNSLHEGLAVFSPCLSYEQKVIALGCR
jgi:hypothetical protein